MTKDEMKNRISMALKDPILQQGFEIICKELEGLENENKTISRKANEAIADKLIITAKYNEVLNSLNQENDKLQKENAELKEKLKPENCLKSLAKSGLVKFTCENGNEHDRLTKAIEIIEGLKSEKGCETCTKFDEVKLTKAKEIIKNLMEFAEIDCREYEEAYKEAEQFLKEE